MAAGEQLKLLIRAVTLLVLGLSLAACAASPGEAASPTPAAEVVTVDSPGAALLFQSASGDFKLFHPDNELNPIRDLPLIEAADIGPVWAPDGHQLAYVSFEFPYPDSGGALFITDINGGRQTLHYFNRTGGGGDALVDIGWSPDGTKILVTFRTSLYVFNADGSGDVAHLLGGRFLTWSPDGSKFAFAVESGDLFQYRLFDINGGQIAELWSIETESDVEMLDIKWSPDGNKIAFMIARENASQAPVGGDLLSFVIVDLNSGKVLFDPPLLGSVPGLLWSIAWSPDGQKVAYMDGGDIYVLDLKDGNQLNLTYTSSVVEAYPVWSPDGNRIAFIAYAASYQEGDLFVVDPDGKRQTRLSAWMGLNEFSDPPFAWSPDGSLIAFSSQGELTTVCGGLECIPSRANTGLYLVDVESGETRYLTSDELGGLNPSWQPQP